VRTCIIYIIEIFANYEPLFDAMKRSVYDPI